MINEEEIRTATQRLERMFCESADNPGTRLVRSVSPSAACFGQQLDAQTVQRGLHGTAGGLFVLSASRLSQANAYVSGIVTYCQHRSEIERDLGAEAIPDHHLTQDRCNVIKLSEILYGLAETPTNVDAGSLSRDLAADLIHGKTEGGGWSYYLKGPTPERNLLPTSWAVLALDSHKYEVQKEMEFLAEQLRRSQDSDSDIWVQVFALFVLTYAKNPKTDHKVLKQWFKAYWRKLSPLLNQPIESNIEYLSGGPHYSYVRVPWQLYLLACAARLAPYKAFSSRPAQDSLRIIVGQVMDIGGLVYPHSGRSLSTRTNAILYDTLSRIHTEMKVRRLPLTPFFVLNKSRDILLSTPGRWTVKIVALTVIGYSIWSWITTKDRSLAELGPELITSALVLLLAGKGDSA